MYQKADGYDTFAKSKGVTQAYINNVLLKVCDYKCTLTEKDLVMSNSFPPIYACQWDPKGRAVQSRLSFVPLDYTGERSSCFAVSVILSPEETKKIERSDGGRLFNSDNFDFGIEDFKLDAPIKDYPDRPYRFGKVQGVAEYGEEQGQIVMTNLLFALLNAALNKNKTVYISFNDVPAERFSDVALDHVNNIYQLLPACIKRKLPFVTYTNDYRKFPFAKVKFVSREHLSEAVGKGYVFDMTPSVIDGVGDKDYKAYGGELEFLYRTVLDEGTLRSDFHEFVDGIVEGDGRSAQLNMKMFSELVLLFRQISGETPHDELLPGDDEVYNYFSAYEKHRAAMLEEDRMKAYSPLERYVERRAAIPNKTFNKLTRLYDIESEDVKDIIMKYILDLIHTDAMRERLFRFINTVFDTESEERKEIIIEDLSRVFYGGFLQDCILELYARAFPSASEESVDAILNKLLLSIRTECVQDGILKIIRENYSLLTDGQKDKVIATYMQMLPEADELSGKILSKIGHIADVDPERTEQVVKRLVSLTKEDREYWKKTIGFWRKYEPTCPGLLCRLTARVSEQDDAEAFAVLADGLVTPGTGGVRYLLTAISGCRDDVVKEHASVISEAVSKCVDIGEANERLPEMVLNSEETWKCVGDSAVLASIYENIFNEKIAPRESAIYAEALTFASNPTPLDVYVAHEARMPAECRSVQTEYVKNIAGITGMLAGGRCGDAFSAFARIRRLTPYDAAVGARVRDAAEKGGITGSTDKRTVCEYLGILALFCPEPCAAFAKSYAPFAERTVTEGRENEKQDRAKEIPAQVGYEIMDAVLKFASAYADCGGDSELCSKMASELQKLSAENSAVMKKRQRAEINERVRAFGAGLQMADAAGAGNGSSEGKKKTGRDSASGSKSFFGKLFVKKTK